MIPRHQLRIVKFNGRRIGALRENPLDRAVQKQIGVTPDRRREVRIGRILKTKVPDIFRLITRALHRAQNGRLQIGLIFRIFNELCQYRGEILRPLQFEGNAKPRQNAL